MRMAQAIKVEQSEFDNAIKKYLTNLTGEQVESETYFDHESQSFYINNIDVSHTAFQIITREFDVDSLDDEVLCFKLLERIINKGIEVVHVVCTDSDDNFLYVTLEG